MLSSQPPSANVRTIPALLMGFAGLALWRLAPATPSQAGEPQSNRVIISRDRFGETSTTDYVSVINAALDGRSAFIGAKIDRTYSGIEHIRRTVLGLPSDATIAHRYAVTYPIGFDIRPGRLAVTQDGVGVLITLDRPRLLSWPGIRFLGHDFLDRGLFISEDAQIIAFQRRQLDAATARADTIAADPAVIALCEQRLGAFLRAFLAKQPGASPPPAIRFAYR